MARRDYTTVSIPIELAKEIEKTKGIGYQSISDFVRDAIRQQLIRLKKPVEVPA